MILFVFVLLVILMFLGVPVLASLSITAVCSFLITGDAYLLEVLPQRMFSSVNSFPLMAVIFFMIAGELMLQGGISVRIVNMAKLFLYRIRGSLAIITYVACGFFGALSGSNIATTVAIGRVMYPEMLKDESYPKAWAVSMPAVGGMLGPMIPPSILLVLYGNISGTSVGDLFVATAVPGVLVCVTLCITAYVICKKKGYGVGTVRPSGTAWTTLNDSIWALLTPVIILGGIYTGIFSPTEAAAVACVYAFIVGAFVYKELNVKTFFQAVFNGAKSSAAVMLLVATANYYGWMLTMHNIPQQITEIVTENIHSPIIFLIAINIVFLILGMFVDSSTIVMLVIPLLVGIVNNFGINPVHFGVITGINLSLGAVTPPFGVSLFAAHTLDKSVSLQSIYRHVLPFIFAACVTLMLITFVPQLSLFLIQ